MRSDRLRWSDIRKTSAFRLALLLEMAAMAGLLFLLVLIYGLISHELNQRSDRVLHTEASRLASVPTNRLPAQIERSIGNSISGLNYFGLVTPDGRLLAGNLRLPGAMMQNRTVEVASAQGIDHPLRIIVRRTPSGAFILIGRDIGPLAYLRTRMKQILLVSAVVIMPLLLLVSLALSIGPLRRVNRLQQVARTIASGHLDARMPVTGRRDELDLFADTVNQMITAVERTVGQVKSVTDAIAHDLRTPLTHVRNQLYRTSREAGLAPQQVAKIDRSIDELDFVIERFAALLRISELEATKRTSNFAAVRLDELAASVAELYAPLAEDKNIVLSCNVSQRIIAQGDEKLLFEAVSNLIDNAIKFTPDGGIVIVGAGMMEDTAYISVSDNGPGVPAHQRNAILRRFDRGSAAVSTTGSGLGLSIVMAIVQVHQFSLELDGANPGLTVRIMAKNRPRNA
ncbi:HAMP domain protein [Novosphingobium sp. Rr 2-17]|uniref:sensor histidine kinase n=1 Tax=Novosphingobium sp. Rr 2-17 TaxID=555793 RepID=UPI0002698EB2|nr:HAMP domain-containing sensor histidine kinase [Novosphingobium sp. Rr 2-17]EIZ80091.1 HAMP domain protein [Novosphingobium sp. Rr 2-17]